MVFFLSSSADFDLLTGHETNRHTTRTTTLISAETKACQKIPLYVEVWFSQTWNHSVRWEAVSVGMTLTTTDARWHSYSYVCRPPHDKTINLLTKKIIHRWTSLWRIHEWMDTDGDLCRAGFHHMTRVLMKFGSNQLCLVTVCIYWESKSDVTIKAILVLRGTYKLVKH